jgi:hypothetical protein
MKLPKESGFTVTELVIAIVCWIGICCAAFYILARIVYG